MFNCNDKQLDHHISSILANYFNNKLKNITGNSYSINVGLGYSRCLARVWDINNPNGPDINKRCRHVALDGLCVCKTHLRHNKHGMVNEYPPEHVVRVYSNRTKNIVDKINTNHTLNIIENIINKHLKKNITYKSKKMSLEQFNYIDEIKEYTAIHNELNEVAVYEQILKKLGIAHASIAEKKSIECKIIEYSKTLGIEPSKKNEKPKKIIKKKKGRKLIIKKKSVEKIVESSTEDSGQKNIQDSSNVKNFNLEECECIKIIDSFQIAADVYVNVNDSKIYNDKKHIIGSIFKWIDEEDEIPESFKNADNLVLHPKTRLPLLEYVLNPGASIFCSVEHGTYREYGYDEDFESFQLTNQVLRCE